MNYCCVVIERKSFGSQVKSFCSSTFSDGWIPWMCPFNPENRTTVVVEVTDADDRNPAFLFERYQAKAGARHVQTSCIQISEATTFKNKPFEKLDSQCSSDLRKVKPCKSFSIYFVAQLTFICQAFSHKSFISSLIFFIEVFFTMKFYQPIDINIYY